MTQFTPHLPVGLLLGGLLFTPALEAKTLYRLKTLGPVTNPLSPDYTYGSSGTAINDSGIVTGITYFLVSTSYQTARAIRSNQEDTLYAFGSLDGIPLYSYSFGRAINAHGQIAGEASAKDTASGSYSARAFLTNADGDMLDLGTLGGFRSEALAINDSSQVTGFSETNKTNFDTHAFFATIDGPMTDLGTLGGNLSAGYAINNSGQVTGYSYNNDSRTHAFITEPNGQNMRDLLPDFGFSEGKAINSSGQVAGSSMAKGETHLHAFVTGIDGANPQRLTGLNETESNATGINDSGVVVGAYTHKSLGARAFVTDINGNAKDLNSLLIAEDPTLCTSLTANDINNSGQITGKCSGAGGISNVTGAAIVLTPEEIQPVPADKKNSLKLGESQQDTLNCDAEKNCSVDTAASGSYALTLKLSADTLNSHGIDLSQLQTSTRFAFNTGSYAFSGSLSSARPEQKATPPPPACLQPGPPNIANVRNMQRTIAVRGPKPWPTAASKSARTKSAT